MALKTNSSFSIRQKFVAPLKALAKKNSNPVSNLVLRTAEELRGKLELFELPLKPESSLQVERTSEAYIQSLVSISRYIKRAVAEHNKEQVQELLISYGKVCIAGNEATAYRASEFLKNEIKTKRK